MEPELGDGRRWRRLVDHQTHPPGGDGREATELLLNDDLPSGDPLVAIDDIHVIGLDPLVQGDVFLEASARYSQANSMLKI